MFSRRIGLAMGLLVVGLTGSSACGEDGYQWTDRSERFRVQGNLMGIVGDQVLIRKTDAELVQIEREQLSVWDNGLAQKQWEDRRLERIRNSFPWTMAGYSPVYGLRKDDGGQLAKFSGGFLIAHDERPERWYYLDIVTNEFRVAEKAPRTDVQTLADTLGIAKVAAWEIRRQVPHADLRGRIVRVDQDMVYINLGKHHGLRNRHQFVVSRGQLDVSDPVERRSLGVQKAILAKVTLHTVEEQFSIGHARWLHEDTPTPLMVGDTVTIDKLSTAVAVLPLTDTDYIVNLARQPTVVSAVPQAPTAIEPVITATGQAVSERMMTELTRAGVTQVDRATVQRAMQQIRVPGEGLYDPTAIQEFGQLTRARYVLAGTTGGWRRTKHPADQRGRLPYVESVRANVRLMDVDTGEVFWSLDGRYYGDVVVWP